MDNRGEIVIYQTKDGKTSIDVKLENETVWLNQARMAELFQTCLLYTSPSPRDMRRSRMPSSA